MFEKLEELAKNNKKISDFHIRAGSPLAFRQTGEIIMVKDVLVTAAAAGRACPHHARTHPPTPWTTARTP